MICDEVLRVEMREMMECGWRDEIEDDGLVWVVEWMVFYKAVDQNHQLILKRFKI